MSKIIRNNPAYMGITFMMCFAVLSALLHCSAGGVVFNYMILIVILFTCNGLASHEIT